MLLKRKKVEELFNFNYDILDDANKFQINFMMHETDEKFTDLILLFRKEYKIRSLFETNRNFSFYIGNKKSNKDFYVSDNFWINLPKKQLRVFKEELYLFGFKIKTNIIIKTNVIISKKNFLNAKDNRWNLT